MSVSQILRSTTAWCSLGLFLAVPFALLLSSPASAQLPGNVETQIRPFVHVSFPDIANSPVALGVFDTGNDNITIAPETNALVGIGVAVAGDVWQNDDVVGNFTNVTAGGFLGAALDGPEVNSAVNTPAHILTASSRLANSQPAARGTFAPSLTYFVAGGNFANSLVNIGTGFVSSVGGGEGNLVAEIDPINAQAMPFALRNRNPAIANPNPPPANLTPSSLPLDQRASSVSYFTPTDARVPTLMHNANPNFLTSLTFNIGGAFTRATTTDGGGNPTGTTLGPLLTTVTLGNNNIFGIAAGNYSPDTGAPNTGLPGGLLGTDNLNLYGQYWDFSANANNGGTPSILLFGPRADFDRSLAGPGVLFGVDRDSVGLTRTGVNELRAHGVPPVMDPNDPAFELTPLVPEQAAGIFRTHMSHSNADYISGVDALDLNGFNNDHIDALSLGGDTIVRPVRLYFSVDNASAGFALSGDGFGGGVDGQAALGQQMGDVFESDTGQPALVVGTNRLRFNQDVMGLGSNVGPTMDAAGRGNPDNLSSLDLRTQDAYIELGLNTDNVMRNLDPAIIFPGDTTNPDGELSGGQGARADVYGGSFDTYFSLDGASTSLAGSGADILRNNAANAAAGSQVWAPAAAAGLLLDDDIDAISLDLASLEVQAALTPGNAFMVDPQELVDGRYAPGGNVSGIDPFIGPAADMMLFSLAPGSPSLGLFDPILNVTLSAADVFITDFDGTFSLFASAESLGLLFGDNIDALDSAVVPEPRTLLLTLFGLCLGLWARQFHRHRAA